VPLSDVLVDAEVLAAAARVIGSGWWSMGPEVEEFEGAFASFCGAQHALAVANGTAALHLALLAAGCGRGDQVIVPALNFVAAANAISHCGATPVFCDVVGAHDLNLDPADVEAAIGPHTKAILALHYGGQPCAIEALLEIADRHGLPVIEDAAHAPGATVAGRHCGTWGLAGCFSFFSNKNLPTGEGGMIVTDDDELAERIRLLRSHGMTTLTWARHRGHAAGYDVLARGFNYRLDEVHAALGLVGLARLTAANESRARIASRYRAAFEGRAGLSMPFAEAAENTTSAHHLAVAVLPSGTSRDEVRAHLASQGVQTSVHYPPIHHFSEYLNMPEGRPLPMTDSVAGRILTLPLYAHMSDEQVTLVTEGLLGALEA
jgi:dTDP-4-amino-4,6-dideoxygalactose transaminase